MNRERTTKQTISPEAFAESKPALDEATVRMCIEAIRREHHGGRMQGVESTAPITAALESLLPTPEPPLPTHYIDANDVRKMHHIDTIKRRHGLLTPEEAYDATARVSGWARDVNAWRDTLLAALRLAAKGGQQQ